MLDVLDAGGRRRASKRQADALRRPGLDLRPRRPRRAGDARPPADRRAEFDQRELLALEKETLGLYVTSHPLADVRDQLRRKVDCRCASSPTAPTASASTVGGIIAGVRAAGHEERRSRWRSSARRLTARRPRSMVFNSTYAACRELLREDHVSS